jgi:DNA polymerase-3 subunit beta
MKLTCLPDHLSNGLAAVSRVISTRSTLPVLGNVLLEAEGTTLTLTGTNLELTVRTTVQATVDEPGRLTLPARLLSDYVALLTPSERLTLSVAGSKMRLSCGTFTANVSGIDADEFPAIPSVSGGTSLTLPASRLKEAIGQVVFAAAPDDSRPVLAGVLMTVSGGKLTMAAADGFRLAVRKIDLGEAEVPDLTMIVPAKALNEVARGLPNDDEVEVEIAVTADQSQVLFRHRQAEVVSRLIEGQFPDFNRIIPRETKTRVTIQTADFLRAVKISHVFARDNSMIVRLNIQTDESIGEPTGRVTVSATASEIGASDGQVDATVDGDDMRVAFNGRYLRDALEAIETGQAVLEATGPASPGVIRPADAALDYTLVIMPIHVNGGAK